MMMLDLDAVNQAVAILRTGGLVVFPTDTVYGVACLALDEKAVLALYAAKGRDFSQALPVMIASPAEVAAFAAPSPAFWTLAARFWPGPLTLILPKTPALPTLVTAGSETVGLRIPAHPYTLALLAAVAAPLAVTSANRSGEAPARTAQEARAQLGDRVAAIVDGGQAPGGRPSTVLNLTVQPPRILRPGPVLQHEIEEALGHPVAAPAL